MVNLLRESIQSMSASKPLPSRSQPSAALSLTTEPVIARTPMLPLPPALTVAPSEMSPPSAVRAMLPPAVSTAWPMCRLPPAYSARSPPALCTPVPSASTSMSPWRARIETRPAACWSTPTSCRPSTSSMNTSPWPVLTKSNARTCTSSALPSSPMPPLERMYSSASAAMTSVLPSATSSTPPATMRSSPSWVVRSLPSRMAPPASSEMAPLPALTTVSPSIERLPAPASSVTAPETLVMSPWPLMARPPWPRTVTSPEALDSAWFSVSTPAVVTSEMPALPVVAMAPSTVMAPPDCRCTAAWLVLSAWVTVMPSFS